MLSNKAMDTWAVCFTHESYDPNVGKNYEELELVGDHAMEYNFIKYLYLTIPGVTRSEMSELKSKYISKSFQAREGKKMGLDKWVKIRGVKTIHVSEDLLESFFGGLNIIGDKVFKFGAGDGLCYNMITKIFENIQIDRTPVTYIQIPGYMFWLPRRKVTAKGKSKTQIKELFEKLHWGVAVESSQEGPGDTVTATVSLTQEAMGSLRSLNVNVTTPTLAIESGQTKKVAFENAYIVALENIRKMGITDDWVQQYRGVKELANPELIPYIVPAQNRLHREGFVGFYFKKTQSVKKGNYIELIGIKPDKMLEVLEITDGPIETDIDGKREVLQKYAEDINII